MEKKALIMDENAIRRAVTRITYEILQILSISLTDKTIFRDLFNKTNFNNDKERCGFSEPSLFNF